MTKPVWQYRELYEYECCPIGPHERERHWLCLTCNGYLRQRNKAFVRRGKPICYICAMGLLRAIIRGENNVSQ